MAVDGKKADTYLRELMQKFEQEKDSLDPYVRRLILKYKEAQGRGDKVLQDLDQLRNQIKQAEARVRSLELQAADIQGKATGFLDVLVSMEFEQETEIEIPVPGPRARGPEGEPRQRNRGPVKEKLEKTEEPAVDAAAS